MSPLIHAIRDGSRDRVAKELLLLHARSKNKRSFLDKALRNKKQRVQLIEYMNMYLHEIA